MCVLLLCSAWAPMEGQSTIGRPEFEAWLGQWITSHLTVKRCLQYVPLIDRWNPDFDLPADVILALMAAESACYSKADDGMSVGLMAVTPRSWLFSKAELLDSATNVYAGMYILAFAQDHAGDLRTALAAYNCGFESLEAARCVDGGGYDYADQVLDFWLPIVESYR